MKVKKITVLFKAGRNLHTTALLLSLKLSLVSKIHKKYENGATLEGQPRLQP